MASFRAHISLGIASGVLGAIGLVTLSLQDSPSFLIVLFVVATLGSVLPDMDSDSGIPFHVAFGSLSTVVAALIGRSRLTEVPGEWGVIAAWTAGAFFFTYIVIGTVFKRFTKHRGMAHSLPAGFLAALVTFFLAAHFSFSDTEAFLLGVALFVGFIGHLILDELYAAVNFHGTPFVPNKAFGSALKLFSNDKLVNLMVYGAILFLMAGNVGRLSMLAEKFWKAVS